MLEKKFHNGNKIYYSNFAVLPDNPEAKFEIELDKSKTIGRGRSINNPIILEQDKMFSNNIESVSNTAISLKRDLLIRAHDKVVINYYTIVADSEDEIKILYEKYTKFDADSRLFEIAYGRGIIENRFLGYKAKDVAMYNKLLSEIINDSKSIAKYEDKIRENKLKQSDLWKFGISGDFPIILLKIEDVNDAFALKNLINATEYFFRKNIKIDLVILNEEENSYEQYVNDKIFEIMAKENANYLFNVNGGIHILKENQISKDEVNLLYSCSDVIVDAKDGGF